MFSILSFEVLDMYISYYDHGRTARTFKQLYSFRFLPYELFQGPYISITFDTTTDKVEDEERSLPK